MSPELSIFTEPASVLVAGRITELWMHKLVTSETTAFRERSSDIIEATFADLGVSADSFFSVPAGSARVAIDPGESDIDCFVVFSHNVPGETIKNLQSNLEHRNSQQHSRGDAVDILATASDFDIFAPEKGNLAASILLTPDDFLGGNVAMAGSVRKELVELFAEDPAVHWPMVQNYLDEKILNWRNVSLGVSQGNKRILRTELLMWRRAIEDGMRTDAEIQEWIDTYTEERKNFTLPSFYTYLTGMNQTDGALSLDQRFFHQGVLRTPPFKYDNDGQPEVVPIFHRPRLPFLVQDPVSV